MTTHDQFNLRNKNRIIKEKIISSNDKQQKMKKEIFKHKKEIAEANETKG